MNPRDQSVYITLPVYNEEKQIYKKVQVLHKFTEGNLRKYNWKILIADNGSNDKTSNLGKKLAQKYKRVEYYYTPVKGRGKVLYSLWKTKQAGCYVFMDIDLSTNLKHLPELVEAILEKKHDISIGSRNLKGSRVKRTLKRTIISKGYITLLKLIFGLKVSDTQCGFKALSPNAIKRLWPRMNPDNWKGSAWFFDAEFLIIAEKLGLKIFEVPVEWEGSPYTTVTLYKDILEDLRGIFRLVRTRPWK